MKKGRTFRKRLERLGLFAALFALLSGVFYPLSVQAQSGAAPGYPILDGGRKFEVIAKWVQRDNFWTATHILVATITAAIAVAAVQVALFSESISEKIEENGAMSASGNKLLAEAEKRLTQALADNGVENAFMEAALEARAENVPPQNNQLCNTIVMNKSIMTTEQFEEAVATAASSVVETRDRTKGSDGSGPAKASLMEQGRCELGLARESDGYNEECVDKTAKGEDGRTLEDSDTSAFTLDGRQTLEIPQFTTITEDSIQYRVPAPEGAEQKFWTAGLYHCMHLAGARPTPPVKEEIETPDGLVKRAQWNHCAAAESALVRACTNLLAFYTRPNSTFTELIKNQKKSYEATEKLNITLPESHEKGMSSYQLLRASQAACKSNQYYVSQSEGGATHADMMNSVNKCTLAWNAWESMQEKRRMALIEAVGVLPKLAECWQGAER